MILDFGLEIEKELNVGSYLRWALARGGLCLGWALARVGAFLGWALVWGGLLLKSQPHVIHGRSHTHALLNHLYQSAMELL